VPTLHQALSCSNWCNEMLCHAKGIGNVQGKQTASGVESHKQKSRGVQHKCEPMKIVDYKSMT
jgi:hypothetical protein